MKPPYAPKCLVVSATDDDVRSAVLEALLDARRGEVVTVFSSQHPNGVTVTIRDQPPGHPPDVLYGAVHLEEPTDEPTVALPAIPYAAITQVHIW